VCLAIPSKVVKISDNMGTVDADGVKRVVSLLLLDNVKVGEYVIVHAGFAINKIDESEAAETIKTIREAVSLMDEK
jgi:hydrogenase expression/formation protein HypC